MILKFITIKDNKYINLELQSKKKKKQKKITAKRKKWVTELDLKRIYKPLKKVIKELKWRKYKLKLIIKRLEKKRFEPINDFNNHLQNSLSYIQKAINEIEKGFKNLRNFVSAGGIEKTRPKIGLNFQEKELLGID